MTIFSYHRQTMWLSALGLAVAAASGIIIGWFGVMSAIGLLAVLMMVLVIWKPELAFIASMALVGALSYVFLVGKVKRLEFEPEPAAT